MRNKTKLGGAGQHCSLVSAPPPGWSFRTHEIVAVERRRCPDTSASAVGVYVFRHTYASECVKDTAGCRDCKVRMCQRYVMSAMPILMPATGIDCRGQVISLCEQYQRMVGTVRSAISEHGRGPRPTQDSVPKRRQYGPERRVVYRAGYGYSGQHGWYTRYANHSFRRMIGFDTRSCHSSDNWTTHWMSLQSSPRRYCDTDNRANCEPRRSASGMRLWYMARCPTFDRTFHNAWRDEYCHTNDRLWSNRTDLPHKRCSLYLVRCSDTRADRARLA
jgi:hypothetical protein